MTAAGNDDRSRHGEARIVPSRVLHESEPDVPEDGAVMMTFRRNRSKAFKEIDRTGEQTKKVLPINWTLQVVVQVGSTKYEHVAKSPVMR